MWGEVLGSIGITLGLGVSYVGLYKLGWYSSRKEQEHKIKQKLEEIKLYEEIQNQELSEYKEKILEHLEKLKNHKVEWKKKQ